MKFTLSLALTLAVLSSFAQRVFITGEALDSRRDSFGRLRISDPATVFRAGGFQYDLGSTVWQSVTSTASASVTLNAVDSSVLLATGGASTNLDSSMRVTYEYFRYQAGKSQMILMTGILGNQPAGTRATIGYGDLADGLFFENWGGTNAVVLRSSATGTTNETRVLSSNWGGPFSDYDPTKVNIYGFDFQWLGGGSVRAFLLHNGEYRQVARFDNDNRLTNVYMATPHLPLMYRVAKTTTNSAGGSLRQICSAVMSESGRDESFGIGRSVGTAVAGVSVTNANMAIIGIRPALALGGRTNRARIRLTGLTASVSSAPCRLRLVYKPTSVSGTAWTNNLGAVDYDRVNGKVVTGGTTVDQWTLTTATPATIPAARLLDGLRAYPLALDYSGLNPAELWLVGEAVSGTPVVTADLSWVEEY